MAFINLDRLLALNQDKADQLAQKNISALQPKLNKAGHAIGYARMGEDELAAGADSAVADAEAALKGVAPGSIYDMTQAVQKEAGTNQAAGEFDALLSDRSGVMQQFRAKQQNLSKLLEDARAEGEKRKATISEQYAAQGRQQRDRDEAAWRQQEDARLLDEGRRQKEDYWRKGQSGNDYAGYSDYREAERQKSKPTRQKSIWDFFGR
jgi:hypothetical protein